MNTALFEKFIAEITHSINEDSFAEIRLKNKRNSDDDLKKVGVRLIETKKGRKLSFVYSYPTRDTTKNWDVSEGIKVLKSLITTQFYQADLHTSSVIWHFTDQHRTRLKKADAKPVTLNRSHDQIKERKIGNTGTAYLQALGISGSDGQILKKKHAKFRQINRYIELVEPLIVESLDDEPIHIVDMGAGKAYLSFALYDHLRNTLGYEVSMTGVELRPELVDKGNALSRELGFDSLEFKQGMIGSYIPEKLDILVALHACDTATDDAIAGGIRSRARLIVCSPCCHKQVRRDMEPGEDVTPITRHGIMEERLAEILTDTIRSLVLEKHGYRSKIMEFVSTEHTPKNLLLVGIKDEAPNQERMQDAARRLTSIMDMYGIKRHYLVESLSS